MVRKTLVLATLVAGLATFAVARGSNRVSHASFRIQLRGNATVLSKDQPVRRGSVVLFHRYPDGRLTSVPAEDVAIVAYERGSAVVATGAVPIATDAVPLQPGDAVLLGPMGEGAATAAPAASAAAPTPAYGPSGDIPARLALEDQVFPGDLPAPTGQGQTGQPGTGAMVNGAPIYGGTSINPSLVTNPTMQRTAPASSVPTSTATGTGTSPVGPNGFPTTTGSAPLVDPNGFPATTTTGPQSGAQPIDPNGFPSLTTPSTGTTGTSGTPTTSGTQTPASTKPSSTGTSTSGGTAGQTTQSKTTQSKTTSSSSTSSTPH